MAVCFLETSALVKHYIQETGTVWVSSLFAPSSGHLLCIAQIAGVETIAAMTLRARRGATTPGDAAAALTSFRLDFARDFYRLPADMTVISRAMDLAENMACAAMTPCSWRLSCNWKFRLSARD